jgi:hypothetical protein
MNKKLLFFSSAICLFTSHLSAQWTQRANLTGSARSNACGFSIGTKGYICCGFDGNNTLDDLWEYDPSGNSWTQKANIPVRRQGAVSFVIGTNAYVGTGDDTTKLRDFWKWDQTTNTWTQKQNFLSTARTEACGFSIGAKGYIGTGNDGSNKYDFYEYDTTTNAWTQKADFSQPGRNSCIGFSFGGKGYMGSGYKSGTVFTNIYEYDPAGNTWTYKTMTNYTAYAMTACVIGSTAFFGTGVDDNSVPYANFSSYDLVNDTVTLAPFGGTARWNAVSFSIGNSVFMGTGFDSWYTQDLWEYASTVGVGEINSAPSLVIISNPVYESLQFAVGGLKNNTNAEIFDVKGKSVFKSVIRNPQSAIDISAFPSGVYFLKISSEGKPAVKKFVKM